MVQADKGPVVVAVALGAGASRHALPRSGRHHGEQLVDPVGGPAEADRVVRATAST